MALEIGSRLGHYDVTALIGEGGMGQVYQATDTKLKRQVALKILPEAFSADQERLARFQREAEVLASLNHPNIAAIHGLEEADDIRALVLELVEGPTLADRIKRGPIPLDEALPIAKQIAEALEAAHEAGVIHRDLKPANIKVKDDGTVKVLDFGLAKALDPNPEGDPSQSPTLTAAATQMGVIMGTAAYMSPEQAAGKVVDKRGDIWSFGVVLFEMLTGQRLFTGETVSHVLASVLKTDPDWTMLPSGTSPRLRSLVGRCLDRIPRQRLRDIGEARVVLEEDGLTAPFAAAEGVAKLSQRATWRQGATIVFVLLVGGIVSGLAVWSLTRQAPARPTRFTVSLSRDHPLVSWSGLALSPDGRTLVVPACSGGCAGLDDVLAYRRTLDQLDMLPVPGTEGATGVFFSPDGQWLGVFDTSGLRRMSSQGGPSTPLYQGPVSGASWGPDDTILIGGPSLLQVPAEGGQPKEIATGDEGESYLEPKFLPSGKAALFTLWKGSLETARVGVVVLETGEQWALENGVSPHYASAGYIVFARDESLWAVAFDADRLESTGSAIPVLEGIVVPPNQGQALFTLASDGTLAYLSGELGAMALQTTLVWVDREGTEERWTPSFGQVFVTAKVESGS